ncbi:hypothetical protein [Azohydromonas australica]|uniref:hypothetical protein n=1 Tax=Azohydromonas australica TaxID=364039 RepID=UPI0012EB432F|nr:hypothetical protein [Azohydromonas australica]
MKLVSRRRPLLAALFVVVADTPVHADRCTPVRRINANDASPAHFKARPLWPSLIVFWLQTENLRLEMREKKTQVPEAFARNLVFASGALNAAQQPCLLDDYFRPVWAE